MSDLARQGHELLDGSFMVALDKVSEYSGTTAGEAWDLFVDRESVTYMEVADRVEASRLALMELNALMKSCYAMMTMVLIRNFEKFGTDLTWQLTLRRLRDKCPEASRGMQMLNIGAAEDAAHTVHANSAEFDAWANHWMLDRSHQAMVWDAFSETIGEDGLNE